MVAFAEALTSFALEDERLGVFEGRWPVEAMAEHLGHEGSTCSVVPAVALVNVEEDVDAAVLLDAALEHAGRVAPDELVVDDVVGGRPALNFPSLGLVHGENPVLQKL